MVKMNEAHRKELLRFLLLKTAPVRSGVKPAELLRVRHCYRRRVAAGLPVCLYRDDILRILKLEYLELLEDDGSSLVLFFHRETLAATLRHPSHRYILARCGYPAGAGVDDQLAALRRRFRESGLPHEVGIFIGYPAKDVVGFMRNLPATPVHRGDWRVFGQAGESLRRMSLYRTVERAAGELLDRCDSLEEFFATVIRHRPSHPASGAPVALTERGFF